MYNPRMPYPEYFVAPMRQEMIELARRNSDRCRTLMRPSRGRAGCLAHCRQLDFCGCAAGKARPGVALALDHLLILYPRWLPSLPASILRPPDWARSHITGFAPSSPSIALFRDGRLVYTLERSRIENRDVRHLQPARRRLPREVLAAQSVRRNTRC